MENKIKDKFNSWNAMKKRDKIRRLDNLIIKTIENDTRKYIKIMLMILILFKIVKKSDIELEDFDAKKFSYFPVKTLRVLLCSSNLFQSTSV